eukprot:scaffold36536_cov146-Isochrysis_galbana.AAC.1
MEAIAGQLWQPLEAVLVPDSQVEHRMIIAVLRAGAHRPDFFRIFKPLGETRDCIRANDPALYELHDSVANLDRRVELRTHRLICHRRAQQGALSIDPLQNRGTFVDAAVLSNDGLYG